MGFLLLSVALFAGCIKGFCGKKISGNVTSLKGTFYINLIRMLLCIAIGFFVVLQQGVQAFKVNFLTLVITFVSGVSTAMFVVTWIICIRKGAYAMVDVFLMLGVGVTIGLCWLFFGDAIEIFQCIGFLMLIIASIIMCSYSSNIKGQFKIKNLFLLILCGIFNGMSDFSQKWFVCSAPDVNIGVFNFYTYLFSAAVLLLFFLISNKMEKGENDGKTKKNFFVVCIMAICLFAYSYFKTMSAKYILPAILYPLSSGAAIILSALMGGIFFGERLTPKCVIGVFVTISALVVMNL